MQIKRISWILCMIIAMVGLMMSGCTKQHTLENVKNDINLGMIDKVVSSGVVFDIKAGEAVGFIGDRDFKVEPNSAIQPYMATQLVERGKISWDTLVNDAAIRIGDTNVKCWKFPEDHGDESFQQSIIESCQPAMAKVVTEMSEPEIRKTLELLALDLPDQLDQEKIVCAALGKDVEMSAYQLAKAYSTLAHDTTMCSVMSQIAKANIVSLNGVIGMAKGSGEAPATQQVVETVVLLWPIDSPEMCCVLQYPRSHADEMNQWLASLNYDK